MVVLLDRHFEPKLWSFDQWALAILSLVFLAAAVELPMKSLALADGILRKRDWFMTRKLQMPAKMAVALDFKGRVTIRDAQSGKSVAIVTREFGAPERVMEVVTSELRESHRLAAAG